MKLNKTSRILALIASIATSFLIVDALADYGLPAPDGSAIVAQASATSR